MSFDLFCKFDWKRFSIQEEFCKLLPKFCEVPAAITHKKIVFSRKTVQVTKSSM